MTSKQRNIILILTSIPLVCLTIYFYRNFSRFSADKWKNNIDRSTMVTSIIKTGMLDKKSYDETVKMLGEPSFYRGTKTQTKESSNLTLIYLTGGGRFIDLEMLCVDIVNDSVVKVYVDYD